MTSSRDMQPLSLPFFPNIFFKNQFRSTPVWPTKDINLSGKVAVVTGGNQGLGFEAANQLLSLNLSRLIIGVRSAAKGETAAEALRLKFPRATIDVFPLDMLSYGSIQAFVAQVQQLERLDIAILNAGVRKMKLDLVPTTGHEETIQVNYLSTALLCILLLPVLKNKSREGPGRISIISSGLAFQAKFRTKTASPLLPSLDDASTFDATDQYNISKLLGMLFLDKLINYVSVDDVIVNVVDPGFVKGTNLTRDLPFVVDIIFSLFKRLAARSLPVGASTYIDAVVLKGKESHGSYLMSWHISPFVDLFYTSEGKQIAERLWQETITELGFANVQGVLDGLKKA